MGQGSGLVSGAGHHLRVGSEWVALELLTDPFVRFANRRFLPAVEVEVLETGEQLLWYVAASSLAVPLEDVRLSRGTLKGTRIKVRKTGSDRLAPYEVVVLPSEPGLGKVAGGSAAT